VLITVFKCKRSVTSFRITPDFCISVIYFGLILNFVTFWSLISLTNVVILGWNGDPLYRTIQAPRRRFITELKYII
jgi:hypothetical protein